MATLYWWRREFSSVDLDHSVCQRLVPGLFNFPSICITSSMLSSCKEVDQET